MPAPMKLGIDRLLSDPQLARRLHGRRLALLGHPASVTGGCEHSLDALMGRPDLRLCAAFGPQHGMRGDKQDNMVETADITDPRHGIPVFSLYGAVRYPTAAMLETFDTLLVDLQDIGTRIYTYVTTLAYVLDACAKAGKAVWVLDRPNPAGRPVEGSLLEPGWESFVGAGPLPMRHGLTLGELARWFVARRGLDLELEVVAMDGYAPEASPGFRLAAGGPPLGQPQPQRRHPQHGPLLSRDSAVRGDNPLRGPRDDPGPGTGRGAGSGIRAHPRPHGGLGARLARRVLAASLLVRADLSQARRAPVQRGADPHGRPLLPPCRSFAPTESPR